MLHCVCLLQNYKNKEDETANSGLVVPLLPFGKACTMLVYYCGLPVSRQHVWGSVPWRVGVRRLGMGRVSADCAVLLIRIGYSVVQQSLGCCMAALPDVVPHTELHSH